MPIAFNHSLSIMNYYTYFAIKKQLNIPFTLFFTDAPTIKLLGAPQIDLEEGKDSLVLRCEADANPPANIVWRRAGRSEIASLQESMQLRPVSRRDSGLYTCQAQNSIGSSEALSVQLDIKCKFFTAYSNLKQLIYFILFKQTLQEFCQLVPTDLPPPLYSHQQRSSVLLKAIQHLRISGFKGNISCNLNIKCGKMSSNLQSNKQIHTSMN